MPGNMIWLFWGSFGRCARGVGPANRFSIHNLTRLCLGVQSDQIGEFRLKHHPARNSRPHLEIFENSVADPIKPIGEIADFGRKPEITEIELRSARVFATELLIDQQRRRGIENRIALSDAQILNRPEVETLTNAHQRLARGRQLREPDDSIHKDNTAEDKLIPARSFISVGPKSLSEEYSTGPP